MPVYSEYIVEPSAQDRQDLTKLYGDEADKLIAAAQKQQLHLIGGRFNGALIAALTLTRIHNGDYQMARLTVRDITRRRGVARQLVIQCLKDLPDDLSSICADIRSAPELASLLTEMRFVDNGANWQWQRPPRD